LEQYKLFLRNIFRSLRLKKPQDKADLCIYQIYYHPAQAIRLSRKFTPYFNPPSVLTRNLHETSVFLKEYFSGAVLDDGYFGYLSWKFEQKTLIPSEQFLSFVRSNPGYDVYFINPFPELGELFQNVWLQGDYYHPGISNLAQSLLRMSGYDYDIRSMVNDETTLLYANYWVGNKKFWDLYLPFLKSIYDQFDGLPPRQQKALLRNSGYHTGAGYLTFIFERMFSTYLYFNQSRVNAKPFIYSPTQKALMVRHLRKIAGQ
jgi:hypothetical protein